MSHRGNLIIANKHRETSYMCHCALAIPQLMFWGSDFAIQYIKDRPEDTGWYDIVWDEGSILINTDKKFVLFYGGEHISYHLPHRDLYLQLMRLVWTGWDVQWGYQGLIDIMKYIKSSPFDMTREGYSGYDAQSLAVLDDDGLVDEWPDAVISIRLDEDDIRVQYAHEPYRLLPHGNNLVNKLREVSRLTNLVWEHDEPEFPIEGVHIDVVEKRIYFWSASCIYRPNEFQKKWDGWELIWLKDDYQKHIKLTEGRLNLPIPSPDHSIEYLRAYLLIEMSHKEYKAKYESYDPVVSHSIELPNYATYYVDKLPPIEERTKIFNQAVEKWRASQQDE